MFVALRQNSDRRLGAGEQSRRAEPKRRRAELESRAREAESEAGEQSQRGGERCRHSVTVVRTVHHRSVAQLRVCCRVVYSQCSFPVLSGVRQGCVMSALLFNDAIDWVMGQTAVDKNRGIQWNLFTSLENLDFADDLKQHHTRHIP
ncbi:reverse transcriptase [Elysia marginata]|uniref:Reverse transcriptase n=1 Tax=Elysia marginata TaxID=1093978 RepID=A0AAV4ELE5_9GAST|nr:reverse transcriptase [Elysia marginata]